MRAGALRRPKSNDAELPGGAGQRRRASPRVTIVSSGPPRDLLRTRGNQPFVCREAGAGAPARFTSRAAAHRRPLVHRDDTEESSRSAPRAAWDRLERGFVDIDELRADRRGCTTRPWSMPGELEVVAWEMAAVTFRRHGPGASSADRRW